MIFLVLFIKGTSIILRIAKNGRKNAKSLTSLLKMFYSFYFDLILVITLYYCTPFIYDCYRNYILKVQKRT